MRQGAAPRPHRPDDALGGRGVRLRRPRRAWPGRPVGDPACTWPPSPPRSPPAGPRMAVKLADTRDAVASGRRRDRHGHRPGRVPRPAATSRCSTRSCAVKQACGDAHLKVILETGELRTYDNVRRASWLAMIAGADFIKTSTGKISPGRDAAGDAGDARGRAATGARPPGAWSASSRPAASGRPRTRCSYLVLVNETVGGDWLDAGLVPVRCLEPAQRPAAAAPEDAHRPLLRPRLRHGRLTDE